MPADVLIVVPTLGQRVDYLAQTLESISAQDVDTDIVVVVPRGAEAARELAKGMNVQVIDDPGSLPGAINAGVRAASQAIRYVNWIGDDDLLLPGSLTATRSALESDRRRVLAYGACDYIDETGRRLWTSRAGRWAQTVLPWGPDLIPQPGMLVRLTAWREVGGVDESLRFAFDLDLLLKLRAQGAFVDTGAVVSAFRWHPDSLTVSDRTASLDESETVKRRYYGTVANSARWAWERPVRWATRMAAGEVTRRARRASSAV